MKKINEKIVSQGKWLTFKEATFINNNQEIRWEYVSRTNCRETVTIVPVFVPSHDILVIRQFRPVFNKYVIGFPAGLVDSPLTIEATALKELKEETGYSGRIISVSPSLASNSAVIDDLNYAVIAHIDENDTANKNPVQHLENSEVIETHRVKQADMLSFLKKQADMGDIIGGKAWALLGIGCDSSLHFFSGQV